MKYILSFLYFSILSFAGPKKLDSLRSCGEHLKIDFGFGDITQNDLNEASLVELIKREANTITPGFEMKWPFLEKRRGVIDFSASDQIADFAQKNKLLLRGHTLLFARPKNLPAWLESFRSKKEELKQILKTHVFEVVNRYRNRIAVWDVVNEAVEDNGALRNNIFLHTLGEEYIDLVFQEAHRADPKALLFYNDYGLETNPKKVQAVYDFIIRLKTRKVPIHGIGFQAHLKLKNAWSPLFLKKSFEQFSSLGLLIHVTELDVGLSDLGTRTETLLQKQKNIYEDVASECFANPQCKQITFWGISDDRSWLNQVNGKKTGTEFPHFPLLFDRHLKPKPSYAGIIEACNMALAKRASSRDQ